MHLARLVLRRTDLVRRIHGQRHQGLASHPRRQIITRQRLQRLIRIIARVADRKGQVGKGERAVEGSSISMSFNVFLLSFRSYFAQMSLHVSPSYSIDPRGGVFGLFIVVYNHLIPFKNIFNLRHLSFDVISNCHNVNVVFMLNRFVKLLPSKQKKN